MTTISAWIMLIVNVVVLIYFRGIIKGLKETIGEHYRLYFILNKLKLVYMLWIITSGLIFFLMIYFYNYSLAIFFSLILLIIFLDAIMVIGKIAYRQTQKVIPVYIFYNIFLIFIFWIQL